MGFNYLFLIVCRICVFELTGQQRVSPELMEQAARISGTAQMYINYGIYQ
jgi:hypothetical protein